MSYLRTYKELVILTVQEIQRRALVQCMRFLCCHFAFIGLELMDVFANITVHCHISLVNYVLHLTNFSLSVCGSFEATITICRGKGSYQMRVEFWQMAVSCLVQVLN